MDERSSSPISSMAPNSCQETEEEQVPLAPAEEKSISSDPGPSANTPTDTVASSCSQGTKPHSTLSPMTCFVNHQLTPETLDPPTLRLLWEQRELEIQALRWAIQNGQNARYYYILQEVAGIPIERSYNSQNKSLQNQVQKLTLELKAQKEQAQLEKERLEEQLKQNLCMIQQLEAELQAFQKSCLVQLARSSWVGRMLRSQTGSVEVVTAEILRDLSDLSESDESPPIAGESFRLEDVDWNRIAHRYPNLFSNFSLDHKKPQLDTSFLLDQLDSDTYCKHVEKHGKNLEWNILPLTGTSSSGAADSDSSSSQQVQHSGVKKTGHLPQRSSEQMQTWTKNFSGHTEDLRKSQQSYSHPLGKTGLETYAYPDHPNGRLQLNCCLKIVAVSHREKFVRILNLSQLETVDMGGFVLQQLVRDFPVCMYRFPPGTLLAPGHHITVWGEGTSKTKKQPPASLGQDTFHFQSSRGCVTLLVNTHGQVISEHQDPPCVTDGSRIFYDNTDWSIDRFPLTEARPDADRDKQQRRPPPRKGRVREARAKHRKRGPDPCQERLSVVGLRPSRPPRITGTRDSLPFLSLGKPLHPVPEVPAQPEGTETAELLPTLPEVYVEDSPARLERKVRVCRKSVDRSCPMVALSVQSTAESKYGFRFLCCPPITEEVCRRL